VRLLERQDQLTEIERRLREARAGSGKLVLIAGEAGVGKSSLVERFVAEHARDIRALWGACDALATPRALGPVQEVAAQLPSLASSIARADESRDPLFRALLAELARPERASIVVLEDLHWADEATVDFFRFIGRRIQRTSALFIATYRDDELSMTHPVRLALGELTGDHVIRLHLAPLSRAAVEELAKESGRDAALLYQVTGGNPFFVREALASPGEQVPETVRDAVIARLVRCSAATRELAELVSMSPGKTEAWVIESILGPRQAAVDEGIARGLLLMYGEALGFRHELGRLAVHSTLAPEHARTMHQRVFQALVEHGADLTQLVHHAALANNAGAVLEYAPLAGKAASRLGAHREAAAHFGTALRYGVSLPSAIQAELFELHARECSLANQTSAAIASGTQAVALWRQVGNVEAQSRVLNLLSQEYRTVGAKERADESVANAIALLEPFPPSANLAMAYSTRSLLATHRGWDQEALDFGRRALALAREFGDHATESHALCNIGAALLGTGDLSGYEPLEHSLALALDHNLEELAARAYRTLAFYAALVHDFARAERLFREGVIYCEERGIFLHSAYMRTFYTPVELERGHWTEAAHMATELLHSTDLKGVQRVPAMATLAQVRVRRGDPGADELLDEAFALALPTGELNRIGRITATRAEQAWYHGDLERTAREAAIGLDQVRGHTAPWIKGELLFWQSRAQGVGSIPDDIAEPYRLMIAGEWLAASSAWERIGMPYERALALAEGPEEALRESLTILEQLGAGPLTAIVRQRLRVLGARGIPRGPRASTRENPAGLTSREVQVLTLLVHGHTNAELAHRMHVSTKTVEHHVSSILEKLEVHSRTEAVAAAFGLGIVKARA
jgi:DNA-binding CsgD family transcriptional regulator/tetratricopeptide (TPR) repeat protein